MRVISIRALLISARYTETYIDSRSAYSPLDIWLSFKPAMFSDRNPLVLLHSVCKGFDCRIREKGGAAVRRRLSRGIRGATRKEHRSGQSHDASLFRRIPALRPSPPPVAQTDITSTEVSEIRQDTVEEWGAP